MNNYLRSCRTLCVWLLLASSSSSPADETSGPTTYHARDTLAAQKDASTDAQACLDGLTWTPAEFPVTAENKTEAVLLSSRLVRFPSPVPNGDPTNDSVSMEWYEPRDEKGRAMRAPAVVVVHESGSAMPVGRLFARSLCVKGFHAFLIHLPYYGERRPKAKDFRHDASRLPDTMRQGIADVRRARDAVAALPNVDPSHIAVQGTSLGGFVVATCAALDRGFAASFIMLAGGDLVDVINNGEQDTAKLRTRLAEAGYSGQKLKDLLWPIESTRLAHRLDPQTTWLYSAQQDTVVPLKNALLLAQAARLDDQHHIRVPGDHYTAIVHLPYILDHVTKQIQTLAARESSAVSPAQP